MSKTKFTLGPWEAKTSTYGGIDFGLVYIKGGGFDVSGAPDPIANAHLISAAPEMYDALVSFSDLLAALSEKIKIDGHEEIFIETKIELEELLAKARGES
jgi:hypothetical protein